MPKHQTTSTTPSNRATTRVTPTNKTSPVILSEAKNPFKSNLMKLKQTGKNILENFKFKSNSKRDSSFHSKGQMNTNNSKSLSPSSSKFPNPSSSPSSSPSLSPSVSKPLSLLGFTLVELIVVIVILGILATIAFLSFSNQSGSARDGVRISDINSIKKSMEMYSTVGGAGYPIPDDSVNVTYLGGVMWMQGKFGDNAYKVLSKNLSKKTVDPLSSSEYIYSLTASKREYQLKADFENKVSLDYIKDEIDNGFNVTFNDLFNLQADDSDLSLFNSTYADTTSSGTVCYINGNYNSLVTKTSTGGTDYYIAIPSLILTDTSAGNISYDNSNITNLGDNKLQCTGNSSPCSIDYDSQIVYSGTLSTETQVSTMMTNLQNAYKTSNVISSIPVIEKLVNATGSELTSIGTSIAKSSLQVTINNNDGVCGSDNGKTLSSTPTNLCSNGTPSTVTGTGPWSWSCVGVNGGTNASCSANKETPFTANGGTITYSGGYTIHTFTTNGTFIADKDGTVEVLVVAGGGGGARGYEGGGGGAGGIQYHNSWVVTAGNVNVIVGNGGAGGTSYYGTGDNGGNSSFGTLIAKGGGGGGSYGGSVAPPANQGGSGGGASRQQPGATSNQISINGSQSFGNTGGNGPGTSGATGGGGGGAGGIGGNSSSNIGGAGGIGKLFDITGINKYYGGGGGGGSNDSVIAYGGNGGGGNGGNYSITCTNGQSNTGGGGGAPRMDVNGCDGGSGIVIVRYLTN